MNVSLNLTKFLKMENQSVLDISNEEFQTLEWDDQISKLFVTSDAILAAEREEQATNITVREAPKEQVKTAPTNVPSRIA